MRGLMAIGLLIYGVAHPAAVHGLMRLGGLALGTLTHAGTSSAVSHFLGSHWH